MNIWRDERMDDWNINLLDHIHFFPSRREVVLLRNQPNFSTGKPQEKEKTYLQI